MVANDDKPRQLQLFNVEDQFIFIFQPIITTGVLSRIKPNALAIYSCMKCYAFRGGPRKGMCETSVGRMAKICGIGDKAAEGAIERLIENKYLSIVDTGGGKTRAKLYKIFDLLPYESLDQSITGVLVAPYDPFSLREQREEIQKFKRTGRLNTDTNITNIVIQGDMHFHVYIDREAVASLTHLGGTYVSVDELRRNVGAYFSQNIVDTILEGQGLLGNGDSNDTNS